MSREHLGERLSALIDGELGHAERDRALSHLAACEPCRFEADLLRRLKRRLSRLDAPGPSGDFLGRLSALGADEHPGSPPAPPGPPGGPGPQPPHTGAFGTRPPLGASRPIGGSAPLGQRGPDTAGAVQEPAREEHRGRSPRGASAPRLRWPQRPHWGPARYALAGASVVAVALGGAFVAGGESTEAPVVRPALEDYAAEHALTAGRSSLPAAEAPPGRGAAPGSGPAAERGTTAEPASGSSVVRPDPAPRAW